MNEDLENMDDDFEYADDPADFKEEFERWRLLAEQEDDAEAQLNLGQIYQYGLGIKKDHKEAIAEAVSLSFTDPLKVNSVLDLLICKSPESFLFSLETILIFFRWNFERAFWRRILLPNS